MNFFKIKTTWSNAELIVLKVCIATAYLIIGSYFDKLFDVYLEPLAGFFVIMLVWSMYLWIKKMKENLQ